MASELLQEGNVHSQTKWNPELLNCPDHLPHYRRHSKSKNRGRRRRRGGENNLNDHRLFRHNGDKKKMNIFFNRRKDLFGHMAPEG